MTGSINQAIGELAVAGTVLTLALVPITDMVVINRRVFAAVTAGINPCAFLATRYTCLRIFILFTYRELFRTPSTKLLCNLFA